ncbi:MAG: MarR family transcriptional regulator [Pseudomonadota bacterium]|nr:MarR family transcriptional regulator [Pseudomonadota bacterium]
MLFQECICFSLGKVSRQMTRVYRERLAQYGLSQPQFFLLIALYEEDGILITRLAEKVALDKSTLTGILDRLERDGLVSRQAKPDDRRAIHVRLTERSLSLQDDLTHIYYATNQRFISRLTDQEREVFTEVLKKLEKVDD